MPGFPPHAAIHETVELARAVGMPRWTGFLNGILRSISRLLTPDEAAEPSARGLPQVRLQMTADDTQVEVRYVTLKHAVFPDPAADPREYLAEAFSMPVGLTDRWSAPAGSADALRLAAWFATPGVLSLRINATRTTREAFLDQLRQAGIEALPGGFAEAVRLRESARVTSLPGFHEGAFSVQDESAMAITDLLDPQPGESILDLCAAPGGKSTHCAERMRNSGSVAACDLGAARLHAIQQSAERLGLAIIETHSIRDDGTGIPEGPFDAAIVDAPCSNTGVLGKRPEARWRLSAADFAELPGIQSTLLARGADRVRPGGRIVYSTCSIDPAENDDVVRQFLAATPGFSLAKERRSIPGRPGDGGYAALLIKG
jgi:16S rRNA (cytosine967-C5)-methyltransferase